MASGPRTAVRRVVLPWKVSHIWSRKKPLQRGFLSHRFDVAEDGMSMGFEGVKKVETDEDDGVLYS